jgi:ABC-type antimicrobial peptide transport system permease subunit
MKKIIGYGIMGGILGGLFGGPFALVVFFGECRATWCIFPEVLANLSYKYIGSLMPSSDNLEIVGILLPYILIGVIIGCIYGKIKNRKNTIS